MKTHWTVASGVAAVMMAVVISAFAGARTDDPLGIAVSPQKLLLGTVQTGSVIVHTDIPIVQVERSDLTMNGVAATGSYADSLGHIVVVFDEADIKDIVSETSAVLTLTGSYLDGSEFEGSDTVMVEEYRGR